MINDEGGQWLDYWKDYNRNRLAIWASGKVTQQVMKANTRLLNYSERWATQCLCHQLNVTRSRHIRAWAHAHMTNASHKMRQARSEVLGLIVAGESAAVPREEPYCLQSHCIHNIHFHITEESSQSYSNWTGPRITFSVTNKWWLHKSSRGWSCQMYTPS